MVQTGNATPIREQTNEIYFTASENSKCWLRLCQTQVFDKRGEAPKQYDQDSDTRNALQED